MTFTMPPPGHVITQPPILLGKIPLQCGRQIWKPVSQFIITLPLGDILRYLLTLQWPCTFVLNILTASDMGIGSLKFQVRFHTHDYFPYMYLHSCCAHCCQRYSFYKNSCGAFLCWEASHENLRSICRRCVGFFQLSHSGYGRLVCVRSSEKLQSCLCADQ